MTTKELLALVGKATPGPWLYRAKSNSFHLPPEPGTNYSYGYSIMDDENCLKDVDVDLVLAAVNALPALCAEVEALRKDAERYRWLRSGPDRPCAQPCAYAFRPTDKEYPTPIGGDALDAAIDAARSRNEHEG